MLSLPKQIEGKQLENCDDALALFDAIERMADDVISTESAAKSSPRWACCTATR